jgi:LemA protein
VRPRPLRPGRRRSRPPPRDRSSALRQLFAVAKNYPQLGERNFLALQGELSNTEDRIQTSRRFYNANVRDYNQRVKQFPSMILASMFHFQEEEFFEVEEAVRVGGPPQVNFTQGGPPVSFGAPGTPAAERSTSPQAPSDADALSAPSPAQPPGEAAPPMPPPPPDDAAGS